MTAVLYAFHPDFCSNRLARSCWGVAASMRHATANGRGAVRCCWVSGGGEQPPSYCWQSVAFPLLFRSTSRNKPTHQPTQQDPSTHSFLCDFSCLLLLIQACFCMHDPAAVCFTPHSPSPCIHAPALSVLTLLSAVHITLHERSGNTL